jgi:hypothetical protein
MTAPNRIAEIRAALEAQTHKLDAFDVDHNGAMTPRTETEENA